MVDNNKIASLGIQFSKKLSFTMIDKNNIDADESFRIYMRTFGVCYDRLVKSVTNKSMITRKGADKGYVVKALLWDGTPCEINCYLVTGRNGRLDKRFSIRSVKIKGERPISILKNNFNEGDTLGLKVKVTSTGKRVLVVNVDRVKVADTLEEMILGLPKSVGG